MIGKFEQMVLLAVMHAGADAYGITVHAAIHERTGHNPSLASVYKTLERLAAKGLVRMRAGRPTPERGGRGKQLYTLTAAGRRDVRESVAVVRKMTQGLDIGLEMAS